MTGSQVQQPDSQLLLECTQWRDEGRLLLEKRQNAQEDLARQKAIAQSLSGRRTPSDDEILASRWVSVIRAANNDDAWWNLLPIRVGHSAPLDSSINAIITGFEFNRGFNRISACRQILDKTLAAIQTDIKIEDRALSDETVAAIGAMVIFEMLTLRTNIFSVVHIDGFTAILLARPANAAMSDVVQRMLHYFCSDAALLATLRGRPSPLEEIICKTNQPNTTESQEDFALETLSRLGNQLCIRLPRLVALVRGMKRRPADHDLAFTARVLAEGLLDLQDGEAERDLLRCTLPRRSRNPSFPAFAHVSHSFLSNAALEVALRYWEGRLALLRVCRHLPLSVNTAHETMEEMRRLSSSILMVSEHALTQYDWTRRRICAKAFITVWGALRNVSSIVLGVHGDPEIVRAYLLSCTNMALFRHSPLTAKDMDEAADFLVGGGFEFGFKKSRSDASVRNAPAALRAFVSP